MTTYIPETLRRQVIERGQGRCEYCRVHQDDRLFAHEIDHIFAEKHGGQTEIENLGLACGECNRYKGSDFMFSRSGNRPGCSAVSSSS